MYNTNNVCNYNKHMLTPKHKNNDKSEKNEHKYSCECCDYNTSDKYDYNKHLLTLKHKHNYTLNTNNHTLHTLSEKGEYKYSCTTCKYHTNILCNYNKHLHTSKHIQQSTQAPPPPQTQPSLTLSSEPNLVEIIQVLVKENQEIRNFMVAQHNSLIEQNKKLCDDNSKLSEQNKLLSDQNTAVVEQNTAIVEQNKTLTEVVKTLQPANNSYNTTTNNNNQTYTINMFLNEKCKDAQNFSKFIEELKPKVDMLKIYENGYVDGISKLFIDGLSSMEITERPLHCTDERRNTFYVHDNDEWNKDENLKLTKNAIFNISQENMKQCVAWSNNIPPNVDRHDHITQSVKLCKVAWSGDDKNTEKIIKNISKEIPLNKQVINDA